MWKSVALALAPLGVLFSAQPAQTLEPAEFQNPLQSVLTTITAPTIIDPQWVSPKTGKTYTYRIQTRGKITADLAEFARSVNETLTDSRGWSQAGIGFKQVESGGDFVLYLSAADKLPSFGSPCHVSWSCRSGNNVIINQDRWFNSSTAWKGAGGSLRDYRHMVLNHEVGHWLGFKHVTCSSSGAASPIMQQQSISLRGCKANPWPLDSEIARAN